MAGHRRRQVGCVALDTDDDGALGRDAERRTVQGPLEQGAATPSA